MLTWLSRDFISPPEVLHYLFLVLYGPIPTGAEKISCRLPQLLARRKGGNERKIRKVHPQVSSLTGSKRPERGPAEL